MSTFYVFGMTRAKAKQLAERYFKAFPRLLNEDEGRRQERYRIAVEAMGEEIFAGEKIVQVSEGYATPHFAAEWMKLAAAGGNARNLFIRAKVIVLDGSGRPATTDKGSHKSEWKTLEEIGL